MGGTVLGVALVNNIGNGHFRKDDKKLFFCNAKHWSWISPGDVSEFMQAVLFPLGMGRGGGGGGGKK